MLCTIYANKYKIYLQIIYSIEMGDQQVTAAIECFDLTKSYSRHVTALHNITLYIAKGSSFGLLGENGAGKSTLVRILLGFILSS
jgi:ABC-type sugar transport system ATPase subunit